MSLNVPCTGLGTGPTVMAPKCNLKSVQDDYKRQTSGIKLIFYT